MSIIDLIVMQDRELVELLALRQDLLRRLWSYRQRFQSVFAFAYLQTGAAPGAPLQRAAADVVGHTVSLLRRPDDVLYLCDSISEVGWIPLMDMLVMHPNIEPEVVASIVSDTETFRRFSGPGAWVGHAVWRRGILLMQDAPDRKFEIEELIPLGLVEGGSERSLLGAALDRGNLSARATERLLELFPADRYLVRKLSKKGVDGT